LALQGKRWFADGYVLEECMYRGQSVVSRPSAVATIELEVFEELPEEGSIEVLHAQFGRCPFDALRGELKQQSESVPVGRDGVLACTELRLQPVGEETLNERLKTGNAHRASPEACVARRSVAS
jgi:hypothetical protein